MMFTIKQKEEITAYIATITIYANTVKMCPISDAVLKTAENIIITADKLKELLIQIDRETNGL